MARVLVIEDDGNLRSVIRRSLERVGHKVFEAIDGRDGIEKVVRNKLDLVITDLLMPEQEGIETIQSIKRMHPELPIIAMSGALREGEFSILEDATLMGADLALEKPFDVTGLLDAVERALSAKRPPELGRPDDVEGSA